MNTLKFCFKFSDNSDTMIFWIIKYIRTLLQYEYKRKTIFQHSIFFTVAELFFSITSFFTQKNLVCTTIPWLFSSLNELKFQKQQIFRYLYKMIYKQKWIQGSFKMRTLVLLKFALFEKNALKADLRIQFPKCTMSSKIEEFWQISANCKLHYIKDHTFFESILFKDPLYRF